MIKGEVLYERADGAKIIFDEEKDGEMYAHINLNGDNYEQRMLVSLLSKGYWDAVYTVPVDMDDWNPDSIFTKTLKSIFVIPPLRKQKDDDDFNPIYDLVGTHHFALGRVFNNVEKHMAGKHDQSSHGNWAGITLPDDALRPAMDGAEGYCKKFGLQRDDSIDYTEVVANRARAIRIADAYDKLPEYDKQATDEYDALGQEIQQQFDYMTKTLGVKVKFVDYDPYKTSKEMFAKVSASGELEVLKTTSTSPHPYLTNAQNDMFRAVHDYFGHAATGRGFGQDGEEAAWVHHSQMFSLKAREAMTTETRGQNSWYNTRKKGFAQQKVALLPSEYWSVPKVFAKRFFFGAR